MKQASQPVSTEFSTNGRAYRTPTRPVAVICLDGSADAYLDAALIRDRMPNLRDLILRGHRGQARAALPSFTNVNNASIVTGVPPSVHGICGNFFYDTVSDREVMMNSAEFLRSETIFPSAARSGRKVAVVTAKEKLRDIFAHGLVEAGGIAFSSEKASQTSKSVHGIEEAERIVGQPAPAIYSAAASTYVLRAGNALLREGWADFLYLSTTDYMQHKYEPEADESLDFYAALDLEIGMLLNAGTIVGLTADHGMNAKQKPDGTPHVIYLETLLHDQFDDNIRVILPITDPYVKHHGALGSFAVVHLSELAKINDVKPLRENWNCPKTVWASSSCFPVAMSSSVNPLRTMT